MAALERSTVYFLNVSNKISRNCIRNGFQQIYQVRHATSAEVSSALRPFYFAVHPDLFGQHPNERAVNEASLQQLSSYIETVQQERKPSPTKLRFFLRRQNSSNKNEIKESSTNFKEVKLNLETRDIRQVVMSVLKTCSLPTTAAEKMEPSPVPPKQTSIKPENYKPFEGDADFGFTVRESIRQEKATQTLLSWLKKHSDDAKVRLETAQPSRLEAVRKSKELEQLLNLNDLNWDCGWNQAHYIGCLQSLYALVRDHPDVMAALKGRTLIFGSETGVSWDGQVMFNSGEVRHNWLEFVKNIKKYDETVRRIPSLEKSLSGILRDIRVVKRRFQPRTLVSEYEAHLRRLITSLSDYTGKRSFPLDWPEKLTQFRLVVEAAAGPLMLSPTGQFIVPSSCPAFLLVSFFTENLEKAANSLREYQKNRQREDDLCAKTVQKFNLRALRKDDAITPTRMISCCERLISSSDHFHLCLDGGELRITHYYSVLSDGEICIPWDWTL